MDANLSYHHSSGEITVRFRLTNKDEEAFGFSMGSDPETAPDKFFGWFTKESEIYGKAYKVERQKPYVYLYKKNKDGAEIMSDEPINVMKIFEATPPAPPRSITMTLVDF